MKKQKKESVNHPIHYGGDTEYECIKVLRAWNTVEEYRGFLKGNTIKYLCRGGKKDPDKELEDTEKAFWYLKKLVEDMRDRNNGKQKDGKRTKKTD